MTNLTDNISRKFTSSNLEQVCFDLGISAEDIVIPGSRSQTVVRLVRFAAANNMLRGLLEGLRHINPSFDYTQDDYESTLCAEEPDNQFVNRQIQLIKRLANREDGAIEEALALIISRM